ncbi:MAG: hypothetical protein ACYDB3_06750, partial [Acidimicrobiales bacterium]
MVDDAVTTVVRVGTGVVFVEWSVLRRRPLTTNPLGVTDVTWPVTTTNGVVDRRGEAVEPAPRADLPNRPARPATPPAKRPGPPAKPSAPETLQSPDGGAGKIVTVRSATGPDVAPDELAVPVAVTHTPTATADTEADSSSMKVVE